MSDAISVTSDASSVTEFEVVPDASPTPDAPLTHKKDAAAKPKRPSESDIAQQFLLAPDDRPFDDGKQDARLLRLLESLYTTATSKSPHAGRCAEILFNRAFGKVKPSKEETDSLKRTGYQIIVMPQSQITGPVEEFKALPAPQPDFIEAEFEGQ